MYQQSKFNSRKLNFLGENICFEVMSSVANSMNGDVYSDSVTYRARFSAITDKDIKAAFNNLGKTKYARLTLEL